MTSWTDYQDDISDAISDSMDVDWSASVGARAVVAWLNENKPLIADTPRVTVPPQALEAIAFNLCSLHDFDVAFVRENERFATAVITEYARTLSAAPAPEGGAVWFGVTGAADETEALAVALFDARCPGIRMTDEDLHYYRAAAQRAMQAVTDELDTPALASREEATADHISDARQMVEAPAGAGENVNWKAEYEAVCEARISDRQKSQEVINERDKWIAELIQERDALRAQPSAREDAQPFGYWVTHPVGENPVFIRYGSFVPADDRYTVQPLYTHHAPDALRLAAEAFGVITDLSVNLRQGGPDSSDLNDLSDALNTAVDVAHEALAALQAEQGAK